MVVCSLSTRKCLWLLLFLLLAGFGAGVGWAQVTLPDAPPSLGPSLLPVPSSASSESAEALTEAGRKLHLKARSFKKEPMRVKRLLAAIEKYRQAVGVDPDSYEAHLLWAVALSELATNTTQPDQKRPLVDQADERYALASQCTKADARVYPSWVDLLHGQALPLAKDATDWVALHVKLAELCRSGIAAVGDTNPQQRALLQAALGRALVHHAERVQSESDRRRMYLEAIDALVLARRDEAVRYHSQFLDMLGLGYLRLGMLENDPQLLERGVTVYRELLEREPNNATARYNLACVYAQLGRSEEAVEQLRVLVVTGNRKDLLENSAKDADLAPMRESTAYRVLLLEQQQAHSQAKAQQLAEIGDMLQRESLNVEDREQRLETLKQAASRYQEALQLVPDHFRANRGMGMCLAECTTVTRNRAEQRELADDARRHLQKALEAENSDAATFGVLAAFYLGAYNALLTDPDQQINLMGEVIRICRLGLEKARFSVDIARLQAQIGEASTRRGILGKDRKTQREDYLQAIAAFEAASEVETVGQKPRLNELWGVALLRYSSLTKDRLYTRRAIERLLYVLEEDPDQASINYNLSCAYALVGDAKMWQKYYKRSTENDTEGQFYQAALTDPDLDRIRHLPEYQEIFGGHLVPGQLVDPRLTR